MKTSRPKSDPDGLLDRVAAHLESSSDGGADRDALRAWLLQAGMGRASTLFQLKSELDEADAEGRAEGDGWQAVREVVEDLLLDVTITRPDAESPQPDGRNEPDDEASSAAPEPQVAAPPPVRKRPPVRENPPGAADRPVRQGLPERKSPPLRRTPPVREAPPVRDTPPVRRRGPVREDPSAGNDNPADAPVPAGVPRWVDKARAASPGAAAQGVAPAGREPAIPERVAGRYRLVELVHRHADVRVYRGVDEGASPADVSVRLQRTGAGASAVDGGALPPRIGNVAEVLARGAVDGWAYRVSEWVPGDSLAETLMLSVSRPGVLVDSMRWLRQLGAALDRLHASGHVHGDVTPGNVIITPDGDAWLIDCGYLPVGRPRVAGGAGLTVEYASPEALAGAACDPRDDVRALAMVALRLHAPLPPVPNDTGAHPLTGVERPETLDNAEWRALYEALHPLREARTPTARAFVDSLAPRPTAGAATAPARAGGRSRRRSRVRRRWPWAAATLLLAAGAVVWLQDSDPPLSEVMQEWLAASDWLPTIEFRARDVAEPPPVAEQPSTDAPVAELPTAEPAEPAAPAPEAPGEVAEPPVEAPVDDDARAQPVAPPAGQPPVEPAVEPVDVPDFGPAPVPETVVPVRYRLAQSDIAVSRLEAAIMLEVRREGPAAESAEVAFTVVPGSAIEDEDYVLPPQQRARFAAGERATLIVIPLVRGVEARGDRTLTVRLQPPEAGMAGSPGETRIVLLSGP